MHKFIAKRLVIAWVAILGVVFGVLAPTVSQAMAVPSALSGFEEVQVCTMEGMKTIVIANERSRKPPTSSSDHMVKHCAFCVMHGSLFLPHTAVFTLPSMLLSSVLSRLFYQSHAPLFAWTTPAPRGPPAAI